LSGAFGVSIEFIVFFYLTLSKGELVVGKIVAHLYLTLIVKALKISVEHDRIVTLLNIIKHKTPFLVYIN